VLVQGRRALAVDRAGAQAGDMGSRLRLASGAAAVVGGLGGIWRFRRDLAAAHRRLDQVERSVVATRFGSVEFAEEGDGDPVLVSHGIFHGCDGGMASVRDVVDDRRIVVPSRFGYLGSSMPPEATVADQADAFVALLDHLGLGCVDVMAISAGTSAAVQLALRHPDRVGRLVISSGSYPGSPTAEAPPTWARIFYSDAMMWSLRTFARPAFSRLMGIPAGFPRSADEALVVETMLDSVFPIRPRVAGAVFDAFVSNPAIAGFPLEDIDVPVLLIHAIDDPLASYDAAVAARERIPRSLLVGLESGGHLQLGQSGRVRAEITEFLAGPTVARVASSRDGGVATGSAS
jgi:pimeloyl-ACP methyl ester carboxylesterase